MLFNWLRKQVKAAILGGTADALDVLDGVTDGSTAELAAALRRAAGDTPKELPPPEESNGEAANGKRRVSHRA